MQRRHSGFTLIELLITMTIMVILVGLGVITLRGNQATARDDERKADTLAISQQLEDYYRNGSNPATTYPRGQYPPTTLMADEPAITTALRDIDGKVMRAPGVATSSPISLSMATTNAASTPTTNDYIYQPIATDGSLCSTAAQECRKFILYYKLESKPSEVQIINSKNQ